MGEYKKEESLLKSMTAFGRASATVQDIEVTVEIRSVNNRYVDWNIRTPRLYSGLEEKIKACVLAAGVARGKIDLTLSYTRASTGEEGSGIVYEADLVCAESYLRAAKMLAESLGIENDLTASRLMRMPGVMSPLQEGKDIASEEDEQKWAQLEPVVREAAEQFVGARAAEGQRIYADISQKLSGIKKLVEKVAQRSEDNIRSYREKFEERLKSAISDSGFAPDPARVLTECAIYADKAAIDEELVRLGSHFVAFEGLLESSEPVGRRIDFLLQEINREVNTIGSKCVDAMIAQTVVEVKSELEKIREQIQNIE